jgi:glutathione S-transferase
MIYHLTEPARWARSLEEGVHTGSSRGIELAAEGFIHCSTGEQWPTVRRLFYADVDPLLLLHIDESKVGAEVVYEQLGDAPAAFPHIYGPLPLDAVVSVENLPPL